MKFIRFSVAVSLLLALSLVRPTWATLKVPTFDGHLNQSNTC